MALSIRFEIDARTVFNVLLFIFINEIQGETFVKKNTLCFLTFSVFDLEKGTLCGLVTMANPSPAPILSHLN